MTNEDLLHVFFDYDYNYDVGKTLLNTLQNSIPSITGITLMRLELAHLPADYEFPITYFTSSY